MNNEHFYNLLYTNDEFCMELGRVILITEKLESLIKKFLDENDENTQFLESTLGGLIFKLKKHDSLKNVVPALNMLKNQRNCLIHEIHSYFSGLIENTLIDDENIIDSDVSLFIERAIIIKDNVEGIIKIINGKILHNQTEK